MDIIQPRERDGRFGTITRTEAEVTLPASVTGEDRLHEAVLAAHPTAVRWTAETEEWDNGYWYTPPLKIALEDGTTVSLDDESLTDDLVELTNEVGAGYLPKTFTTEAFRNGHRQPEPAADGDDDYPTGWENDIASDVRALRPDIGYIILNTEEYDNGFFWSEEADAYHADGSPAGHVDLTDFASALSEASSYDDLGRISQKRISIGA